MRYFNEAMTQRQHPVEAVNGGVEGYSPKNVLYEIDTYKSIAPDYVVIYLGWNSLFSDRDSTAVFSRYFRSLSVAQTVVELVQFKLAGVQTYARQQLKKQKIADPRDPDIAHLDGYQFPAVKDIARIADDMKRAGSTVYLATLPGLFVSSQEPSEKALKRGHLPSFTNNPFVLAAMTERFNQALRNMAAESGYRVLDLERWSLHALVPRADYFSDSVHLNKRGLEKVGTYLADVFEPVVSP